MNLEAALSSLVPLNSWARCDYKQALGMDRAQAGVYDMKRRVILEALKQGVCKLRTVEVVRPCKSCKATGIYEWVDWHDENHRDYRDCRRCGASGEVKLQFVETNIHGRCWHTPSNRAGFLLGTVGLDWGRVEETDWLPEQPARMLERAELIRLLNSAERTVFEGKMLRWHDGWRGSVYDYYLHLGFHDNCFVCGRERADTRWEFPREIFRPGLKWEQAVCDICEERAAKWPRQWPADLRKWGRWISEHPRWAMNCPLPDLAQSWDVSEWLSRRGIVIGRIPPNELGEWQGVFVDVVAHRNGHTLIRVADTKHWLYSPSYEEKMLSVPSETVSPGHVKLLAGGRVAPT